MRLDRIEPWGDDWLQTGKIIAYIVNTLAGRHVFYGPELIPGQTKEKILYKHRYAKLKQLDKLKAEQRKRERKQE